MIRCNKFYLCSRFCHVTYHVISCDVMGGESKDSYQPNNDVRMALKDGPGGGVSFV